MKTNKILFFKAIIIIFITMIKTTRSKNYNDMNTQYISSNESENQNSELDSTSVLKNHPTELENDHKKLEKDEIDSEQHDTKQENHDQEFGNHEVDTDHDKLESKKKYFGNTNDKSDFENSSHEIVSMSSENVSNKSVSLEYFKPVVVKKFIKINLNSHSFPYTVALLRQTRYISTGALISKQWVLTTAEPFYNTHQYYRDFRVRLGSEDYKKGGLLIPVKSVEMHPEFTGEEPGLNVALVQLAFDAELSPSILPIKVEDETKDKAFPRGFIVTSWAPQRVISEAEQNKITNEDTWVKARKLQVNRLTLETNSRCESVLSTYDIRLTNNLICLKDKKQNNCMRNQGAPLVQDASLWGIMTPWTPPNCQNNASSLLLAVNIGESTISGWIQRIVKAPQ